MTWTIHIGGSSYPATFDKVVQELDEHEKGYFTLQNTAATRKVVDSEPDCTIKFLGVKVLQGVIGAWQIEAERYLKCEVYDKVFYLMDKKTHPDPTSTAVIVYNTTGCDTILTAVAGEVDGVSAGSCPSDNISVKFNRAGCFNIVKFLAQSVNKNFYSTNANTINIADRGSNKGRLEIIGVPSRRKVSNYKKRDKVIIRGVDKDGNDIEGSAGTGDNVVTFTEKKATDTTTLDNIAAYKLDKINKSSHGVKLQSPIEFSYNLNPGDTVTINKEMYGLSGSYKIWRITKYTTYSDVEIDSAEGLLEKILDNQQNMEDFGIYTSAEAVLDNPVGAPSAPAGLISRNEPLAVRVRWSPNSEADLDKYKVYRYTSNDSGSASVVSTQDHTQYIDRIFYSDVDTYYWYWIRAVDRVGNVSPYSNGVSGYGKYVETSDVKDGLITSLKLADRAVTNLKIGLSEISGAVIAAKAIKETHVGDDAITTPKIAASSIVGGHITAGSVTTEKIGVGSVTAIEIAADAVTAAKIKASEVQSIHISAGSITSEKITADQIYGKDFRTGQNVGEGGGPAGIRIVPQGIEAYSGGTTKTFWVSSADGNLYGANGAVKIDNEGLHIIGSGQFLFFRSGDLAIKGAVYLNHNENLTIHGTSGKVEVRGDLHPITDIGFDLGLSDTKWKNIYASGVYANYVSGVAAGGSSSEFELDSSVADDDWTGLKRNVQFAAITTFGQGLYIDTAGKYALAKADSESTLPCVAIAVEAGDPDANKDVLLWGVIEDSGTYSAFGDEGSYVYVSPATAGALTTAIPSGSGDFVQRVGVVTTSGAEFKFVPDLTVIELA